MRERERDRERQRRERNRTLRLFNISEAKEREGSEKAFPERRERAEENGAAAPPPDRQTDMVRGRFETETVGTNSYLIESHMKY